MTEDSLDGLQPARCTPLANMSGSRRQRENRELIDQLRRDGSRIARHFGLAVRAIDPERANVKRRYGICYSDGTIRIRLRHVTSGQPLRYSSLINTLCHELAHLRHFNHGERFKRFYLELLGWARQQGIYRPNRPAPPAAGTGPGKPPRRPAAPGRSAPTPRKPVARGPEQLSLF